MKSTSGLTRPAACEPIYFSIKIHLSYLFNLDFIIYFLYLSHGHRRANLLREWDTNRKRELHI